MSVTSNFITWLNSLMNTEKETLAVLSDYTFKIYYLPEEQNWDGKTDMLKYIVDKYDITSQKTIPCVVDSNDSSNDPSAQINYSKETLSIEMFVEQSILSDVESVIEAVRYTIKNTNGSAVTLNSYNYVISMNSISTGNTQNYNATDYVPVMFTAYFECGTAVFDSNRTIEFKFPDDTAYWEPVIISYSKGKYTKEVPNNPDSADVVNMNNAEVTITSDFTIVMPNDANAITIIDECELEAVHSVISVKKTYVIGTTTKVYTSDERIMISELSGGKGLTDSVTIKTAPTEV